VAPEVKQKKGTPGDRRRAFLYWGRVGAKFRLPDSGHGKVAIPSARQFRGRDLYRDPSGDSRRHGRAQQPPAVVRGPLVCSTRRTQRWNRLAHFL